MIVNFDFTSALKSSWIHNVLSSKSKWTNSLGAEIKNEKNNIRIEGSDYILKHRKIMCDTLWSK